MHKAAASFLMDEHFIHLTVLRIVSFCKPACNQHNQRQCCPAPTSSCAGCAQPCCREILFQKLLLPLHPSWMHCRKKGFSALHPPIHSSVSWCRMKPLVPASQTLPLLSSLSHFHQSNILQKRLHHLPSQADHEMMDPQALSAWAGREAY